MKPHPLVSVIIPCFQAENFVREAVESVAAQTYPRLETFAIDDGSTDNTLAILEEYRQVATVLRHPGGDNRGVSLTRKLGIDRAQGKYIAFLDADDYFAPDKIAVQIELLENRPDVVLCHTGMHQINEMQTGYDGRSWFNYTEELDQYDLKKQDIYLRANRICNSSVMIRADVVRSLPFAGEQLFQFEDWLTWTLAAEHGEFIYCPQQLLNYRVHPASATSAVLDSRLRRLYSYLEYYLAVFAHSRRPETRQVCVACLLEKLDDLADEYAGCGGDGRREKRLSAMLRQLAPGSEAALPGGFFERLRAVLPQRRSPETRDDLGGR